MLYYYFFNMLKVGVPGFTQTPQLLVYNQKVHIALRRYAPFLIIQLRGNCHCGNYISLIAACAAARRAIGTRNGLQDT